MSSGLSEVAEGVIIVTLTDPDETMNLEILRQNVEDAVRSWLNKRIMCKVEAMEVERA